MLSQYCETCQTYTKLDLEETISTEGGWECGECGDMWNLDKAELTRKQLDRFNKAEERWTT